MSSPVSSFTPAARPWSERARQVGLASALVVAIVLYAWSVDDNYPLRHWLFFVFARAWLASGLFALASLAGGMRLLGRLLPAGPRLGERLLLGFALGVLLFVWGIFVAGLLGLFGRAFFFLWPATLFAFGARAAYRDFRRVRAHLARFGARLFLPRGPIEMLAALLLTLSLAGLYLQVLTPLNLGADAHWYHLPIAEHYAARGAIRPFQEGWYLGAYPQLASLLYTWAFQAPGSLFDHTTLSSHLEWTLFLATLAGVSVLARRLLSRARAPFAAAAMFLFPGLFLYDSSLITGADHVLAFWAPPVAVALCRMGRRFSAREAVLAGALTAGAVLTKYQGSYLLIPASLFTRPGGPNAVRAARSGLGGVGGRGVERALA